MVRVCFCRNFITYPSTVNLRDDYVHISTDVRDVMVLKGWPNRFEVCAIPVPGSFTNWVSWCVCHS